jgi:hypothetical protein
MSDGSRHSLSYIAEATYNVTPATPAWKTIRNTGVTLSLKKESLKSEEIRNDRQIADFRHGAKQVGGDISVELSYGSFDDLLEAVTCGTWAADELKAGIIRRSFSMQRDFSDFAAGGKRYHRFTGVEINKLSLQVTANQIIKATFSCIGKNMATFTTDVAGATHPAASTTKPMDSFTGQLIEGGVPLAVVTELTLNIDNGMEARFVVGSNTTISPSIKRSDITGTLTAYFEDSVLLDKFLNETESSLEFSLPDVDGNSLTFLLPRLKYNDAPPDVKGDGPITISIPFQALLDPVSGSNIVITRDPL